MSKNKAKKVYLNGEYLNASVLLSCLRAPSYSLKEEFIKVYIKSFCEKNGVLCEEDSYGNLFITKGELGENEFYPCVTAHLDTVQYLPFLNEKLDLIDLRVQQTEDGKHILYSPLGGIGADDKAGVAICLSLLLKEEKLKIFFPVQEELGCWGSYSAFKKEKRDWFDNVGYVIGFDSPEFNRSAWASQGTMLFDPEFFITHIRPVCEANGVTKFRYEPYTDVKAIRENTELVCMNFGNGGYFAHCLNEFLIFEETDKATKLGMDMIAHLGLSQYKIAHQVIKNDNKNEITKFFDSILALAVKAEPDVDFGEGLGSEMTTMHLIKEKLYLKAKKLGIPFNEIEECFNWDVSDGSSYFKQEETIEDIEITDVSDVEETESNM